jgi:predicted translin family RNA/ssDNA-binding protein
LACNTASAKALRTIQQKDLPEINHQLQSWNHRLDEILKELVDYERDYLAEVLQDGQDIQFGRD